MTNLCPINPITGFPVCPEASSSTLPIAVDETSSLSGFLQTLAATAAVGIGIWACIKMEEMREEQRQERARLVVQALPVVADTSTDVVRGAASLVSGLFTRATNWWRGAPALQAERTAVIPPPVAPTPAPAVTPVTPPRAITPTNAASPTLVQERAEHRDRFEAAAIEFVSKPFLMIDKASLKDFLSRQLRGNYHITLNEMSAFISAQFSLLRAEAFDVYSRDMKDPATLNTAIEGLLRHLASRRAELMAKEKELAGDHRFNGSVNTAWEAYFEAYKDMIHTLAPLAHLLGGKTASVTEKEENTLARLHPKDEDGQEKLIKMSAELMSLAQVSDLSQLLRKASSSEYRSQTATLITDLQAADEAVCERYNTYRKLHLEREAIAGAGVDPTTGTFAPNTELAVLAAKPAEQRAHMQGVRDARLAEINQVVHHAEIAYYN